MFLRDSDDSYTVPSELIPLLLCAVHIFSDFFLQYLLLKALLKLILEHLDLFLSLFTLLLRVSEFFVLHTLLFISIISDCSFLILLLTHSFAYHQAIISLSSLNVVIIALSSFKVLVGIGFTFYVFVSSHQTRGA